MSGTDIEIQHWPTPEQWKIIETSLGYKELEPEQQEKLRFFLAAVSVLYPRHEIPPYKTYRRDLIKLKNQAIKIFNKLQSTDKLHRARMINIIAGIDDNAPKPLHPSHADLRSQDLLWRLEWIYTSGTKKKATFSRDPNTRKAFGPYLDFVSTFVSAFVPELDKSKEAWASEIRRSRLRRRNGKNGQN